MQFIGFRGIHSAVSVAQLGAALAMTIARAGLRARRLDDVGNDILWGLSEERNYELDWLALHLGKKDIEKDLGLVMNDSDSAWYHRNFYYSWVLHGMSDIGERVLDCLLDGSHGHGIAESLYAVEKVVAYRRRLGELTDPNQAERGMSYLQWGTENVEVRGTATKLASAIQSATTKVFMSSPRLKNRWKSCCHIKIAVKCSVGSGLDRKYYRARLGNWEPLARFYHSSPELKRHKLVSLVKNGEDQWELKIDMNWRLCWGYGAGLSVAIKGRYLSGILRERPTGGSYAGIKVPGIWAGNIGLESRNPAKTESPGRI
ncbi:hypothetical protein BKA59DRAFT_527516 [Fusarium tricinctum]|uniref:Uncharacterized protein n=1 Tax=Fusarium tricinctum TaxID=61284 RepID=A0A8K0RX83_9HYPO|nr:hypothetical protein BKA59DRAFT_527516 [Fusarium tricinctum]